MLEKSYEQRAVTIYGLLHEKNGAQQLQFAENLLTQHPRDAVLLLALARICMHNQLWGKARDYLEESIAMDADADKYRLLAQLYENQLDAPEQALSCYRKGLELAQSPLPKCLPQQTEP